MVREASRRREENLRRALRGERHEPWRVRQFVSHAAQAAGLTPEQWRTRERLQRLKLWEPRRSGTTWVDELWQGIQPVAQPVVNHAMAGLAVSYVVTLLPELRFLYLNPQAETV